MEPNISIVIPVYNAALYLDECISSILGQSFSSYELICIDDGSSDNSLKILEGYAKKDSRVKIFHQKNKGAGTARNLGLQHATGEYILFLDADDFFEQNMFLNLFREAEAKNADIVVCNADEYDTTDSEYYDSTFIYYYPTGLIFFSASDIEKDIFNFTCPAPWNKLFRKSFIDEQQILFQELKSTNDLAFVYSAFACCSRIAILDEVLVHYRMNNKNSLQGSNNKDMLDAFRALACLKKFLLSRNYFFRYTYSFLKLVGRAGIYTLANVSPERFKKETMSDQLCYYLSFLVGDDTNNRIDFCKQPILIYGAGELSVVMVRCLVELIGIEKNHIMVVVSSLNNNKEFVCDIPVAEINSHNVKENPTVIICSSVVSSRKSMLLNAQQLGYTNIVLFDDMDILCLLKDIVCRNNKHNY